MPRSFIYSVRNYGTKKDIEKEKKKISREQSILSPITRVICNLILNLECP